MYGGTTLGNGFHCTCPGGVGASSLLAGVKNKLNLPPAPLITMSEGQHWAALLDACAREREDWKARAMRAEEELARVKEALARKREHADELYKTFSASTVNLFADHSVITPRVKLDIRGQVQEQHEAWHGHMVKDLL